MIRIAVLWFFLSTLVGYWGRYQRGGFWGIFLFSLIFSPIIGGLGLLLAGPEKTADERTLAARIKRLALARTADKGADDLSITQLMVLWAVWVGFFGAVYWAWRIYIGAPPDARTALQLSFEVATLGTDEVLAMGIPRELLGLERLAVLLFLALLISRLVTAAHNLQMRRVTASVEEVVPDLSDLEATISRQEATLANLRAALDATPPPAVSGQAGPH